MKHLYIRCIVLFISCMYSISAIAQAQSTIPFQYHQSRIFIKAKINGHKTPFIFMVNTGANKTVIDKSTAAVLKLPVIKEMETVEGTAGTEHVSIATVNQLQAGTAIVKNLEVGTRDLSEFITLKGYKVDGILGTDFLQQYAMTIDFKAKKLSFTKPKLAATKEKCIAFEMKDGIPRCEITLDNGAPTYLNYNSGVSLEPDNAVYVNLSQQQWADLKKANPYINQNNYITGKGVGGDIKLQVVKIPAMTINTIPIKAPYLVIQNKDGYFKREDAIGFFGNNLLDKFKKVTVDFPNNRVVLQDWAKKQQAKNTKNNIAQR